MPEAGGPNVFGRVACDDADPGYKGTARILAEVGLQLVEDHKAGRGAGGVMTPAAACGEPLIARLNGVGVVFEVDA